MIGSTLGGIGGGIVSAILGGVAFAVVGGDPVEPEPVAGAVIFSNLVIAGGLLLPELREEGWVKRVYTIITLAAVSLVTWFMVAFLLKEHKDSVEAVLTSDSPFMAGVFILGAVAGLLSGIQVGAALFVYDRYDKRAS